MTTYKELGERVGKLVDEKNAAYGNSFDTAGDFLRLLWPNGCPPDQFDDLLAMARIFDKMKRIATDRDAFGESPYQDIAGYGILGLKRVERIKLEKLKNQEVSMIPPSPFAEPEDGQKRRFEDTADRRETSLVEKRKIELPFKVETEKSFTNTDPFSSETTI